MYFSILFSAESVFPYEIVVDTSTLLIVYTMSCSIFLEHVIIDPHNKNISLISPSGSSYFGDSYVVLYFWRKLTMNESLLLPLSLSLDLYHDCG